MGLSFRQLKPFNKEGVNSRTLGLKCGNVLSFDEHIVYLYTWGGKMKKAYYLRIVRPTCISLTWKKNTICVWNLNVVDGLLNQ